MLRKRAVTPESVPEVVGPNAGQIQLRFEKGKLGKQLPRKIEIPAKLGHTLVGAQEGFGSDIIQLIAIVSMSSSLTDAYALANPL